MSEPLAAGGLITGVEEGAALDAGVLPGDLVVAVDGEPVRDIIDWWWLTDERYLTLGLLRDGKHLEFDIEREPGVPLGVFFAVPLFDGIRECDNACSFCFVSGLPRGLRPALYVRDDDYRLSFLTGNFVTLTNVSDADVSRIIEQHLSPLHVSVHAVSPEVRAVLVCPTAEDRALEVLDRLLDAGIEAHVQIVLVPGVNDGKVLTETLEYLSRRANVLSVGCVPMAYTAHQSRWTASYERGSAQEVLRLVQAWQDRMRDKRGVGWVYAADEFYLLAGEEFPCVEAYDGFPQYENGIGMVRAFLDEFRPAGPPKRGQVLVTGELFAPVLAEALALSGWQDVRVLPVRNDLFGGNVSVAGLLGGKDIAATIRRDGGGGVYWVPEVVLNSDGLLLDGVEAADLADISGADVRFLASGAGSLMEALTEMRGTPK